MIRILFCVEKHVDLDPTKSLSNSFHNLFGSLESTGLAKFQHIHYDEYARKHKGKRIDEYLLQRCKKYKPDIVFFSYFMFVEYGQMLPETIEEIRKMNIKVVFIWWDGNPRIPSNTADLMIDLTAPHPEKNFIFLWPPQDGRIYNDPNKTRDIDACFLGSIYGDRGHYCGYVKAVLGNKINLVIGGGQHAGASMPVEEYADYYQRSKIVFNLSNIGYGSIMKSRVVEGMLCGALVLEQNNPITKKWFSPDEHYVPFVNPDDLAQKIMYYLEHKEERIKIAKQGRDKCSNEYNAKVWWNKVFNQLGF